MDMLAPFAFMLRTGIKALEGHVQKCMYAKHHAVQSKFIYYLVQKILIDHLMWARHCDGSWARVLNKRDGTLVMSSGVVEGGVTQINKGMGVQIQVVMRNGNENRIREDKDGRPNENRWQGKISLRK